MWTADGFGGIYLTDERTAIRSIYSELALKIDSGLVDVSMKFLFSSSAMFKPCCFVQYCEMIDSSSSGTYQTSANRWVFVE